MKHYRYFLLYVSMFTNIVATLTFAQVSKYSDKIWSVVEVNPSTTAKANLNYNWKPAEQVTKYFDLATGITVGPNIRVKPGNTTQSEMSIDVHPGNSNIIFGSANSTNWNPLTSLYGTGVYWSLNGSTTWTGYDNPPFGTNSGDPVSVIGADGRFYENYITNAHGMGVSVSTNNGTSWTTYAVAPNPGQLTDKNHFMVDKTIESPFVNRAYCIWTDFGGSNDGDAVLRYSTNFGQTWSASINLSSSLSAFNQGVNAQTGPNGEVYATWAVYLGSEEDGIAFTKSTNGGVTWSTPTYAYYHAGFGIRGYLSSKNGIRVSSFPSMSVDRSGGPYDGNIYITWPQRGVLPAGSDPDIVLIKSTNGGTTWSSPVRVNDDPINNGKDQYYPWCTVDQSTGQLMLVFYDSRDVPNNQAEVFMARSLDGGSNFENFKVSDQPHTPTPINNLAGGYAGDYIGVAALNNVAYPFWSDNRLGGDHYQAWTALVTFGPPCPVGAPSNPQPVNGATDISISISSLNWTNDLNASQCEVWFGEAGSMNLVYDGSLTSSWTFQNQLDYSTLYNWQIVNKNDTCGSVGSLWSFTTEPDPSIVTATIFYDDFESGLGQWIVTNNGGNCVWEIFTPPYPNSYTLPSSSSGGLLTADSDECGNGTTFLSTATIVPILDFSAYVDKVWIEFDNDWNVYDSQDEAHIEVSTNGGSTWIGIWDKIGSDISSTHELIDVTSILAGKSNVKVRARVVQPGWDWWWVIDNFAVYGQYTLPSVDDPTGVSATAISYSQIDVSFTPNLDNDNVVVAWNTTGVFTEPSGTPPANGQPFAGGELLYNGISSPVNHTELTSSAIYYYKLFSYDGLNYSTGVITNATTLPITADFLVNLSINDDCNNSIQINYGTAPGATDCYDAGLDQWAPPPPPSGAFDGRFVACNDGLFIDIKGTNTNSERVWDVQYQPAENCFPVTLSWNTSQLPPTGYFHLVDAVLGTLVNINMRTTNSFTDSMDIRHLQIKYNYEFCSNYNVGDGWNMLSLPLGVVNNNYLAMFPNAEAGTLYGYSDGYFTADTIGRGIGYWLKFSAAGQEEICGSDETEEVINLSSGWNLIGGPNCNVPLSSVIDPVGIIIPGTLYGYNGGYFTSSSIDATKAYWIKTSQAGTITVSCGNPVAEPGYQNLLISSETLDGFSKIKISDQNENSQTLYFNGTLDENLSIESFSLPPLPPQGSFDIRFAGDYRLSEDDEVTVKVQSSDYPLTVTISEFNNEGISSYVLKEISDGLEVATHIINSDNEIVVSDQNVNLLKIEQQKSIPTTYNLEQNYPNPFNPSTTIKFALPEASDVSLTVYNALGQKVVELVDGHLEAGWYNYQWSANNMATGIYIYELRTNKFISVKKMVLMK